MPLPLRPMLVYGLCYKDNREPCQPIAVLANLCIEVNQSVLAKVQTHIGIGCQRVPSCQRYVVLCVDIEHNALLLFRLEPLRLYAVQVFLYPLIEQGSHVPVASESFRWLHKVVLCYRQDLFLLFRQQKQKQKQLGPEPVLFEQNEFILHVLACIVPRYEKLKHRKESVTGKNGEHYGRDDFLVHVCPPT